MWLFLKINSYQINITFNLFTFSKMIAKGNHTAAIELKLLHEEEIKQVELWLNGLHNFTASSMFFWKKKPNSSKNSIILMHLKMIAKWLLNLTTQLRKQYQSALRTIIFSDK